MIKQLKICLKMLLLQKIIKFSRVMPFLEFAGRD